MGRSAKGYKKPTLKEKQQNRKSKSSLTNNHDGAIKDWSAPSATVRLAAAAVSQSAGPSKKNQAKLAPDEEEEDLDDEDDIDLDEDVNQSKSTEATSSLGGEKSKKKRDLRARSRGATGSGGVDGEEARTPREQGIDYLQLWQGRKKEIASARIKQGRPVQK
ncbi:unnamed protein product [Tilletia controversa]|uniref:Uncharacterized protein n=3 Tax=Tilletia TaxID=13289 RepID=A0A8X7T0X3_9BASI|nr:hypothetical protein CF336_g1202 [Tilletia laevis]KAE8205151.1 hypothetical protein CF328_g667 [Tilletia controversa]KAE8264601.1 hypothetical protein A4X03_0g823 [Tilletia caries]KAE8207459.1 hypothetical protein CF335_g1121 [Tilletia laevis]KAE8254939.1 hypothetical protein A4X06_0g663 [Tilletia controversa]